MKKLGRTNGRKEAGVMATVLAFLAYSVAKSCKRDGAFPILASSQADQLPVDDHGPPFFDPRDARAIRYLVCFVRATQTQATIGRHYFCKHAPISLLKLPLIHCPDRNSVFEPSPRRFSAGRDAAGILAVVYTSSYWQRRPRNPTYGLFKKVADAGRAATS
ncbi:hypothetical protein EDB89DRAFT_1909113 [Lactarius sanguifluus]|nr:hypothetical protein EDB89DRAFT_1909113 [Lactarius sanguifluus]